MVHDADQPKERHRLGAYLDELDAEFGPAPDALTECVDELWGLTEAAARM